LVVLLASEANCLLGEPRGYFGERFLRVSHKQSLERLQTKFFALGVGNLQEAVTNYLCFAKTLSDRK